MVLDTKPVAIDWSLEGFCATQHAQYMLTNKEQWTRMDPSSIDFLTKLDLPLEHPFCTHPQLSLVHPLAPPMGPPLDFKASTMWESPVTAVWYHAAPMAALAYLNAVLIAIYVAPILILGCIIRIVYSQRYKDDIKNKNAGWTLHTELLFHTTLFFTWLVLTDDQYVLGIGRGPGTCLAGLLLLIALAMLVLKLSRPMFIHRALLVLVLCSFISPWRLLDSDEIRTNLEPGLYYNHDNGPIRTTVENWQRTLPDYAHVATPWLWTGDARTGVPYLLTLPPSPNFYRLWMPTVDNEYLALDIAFPPDHGHNASNPLYLVLHGLNGGSQEGYVLDLVRSRTQAGSTVVVMVARGLMDTPIQGWTIFNGIRVSDVHSVATLLRERVLAVDQTLAGVGYSMGGIVLNRYVSTQDNVALDVSVSISGALCSLNQMDFHRSRQTWQRVITGHMKEMFFHGKWGQRLHYFLGHQAYQRLLRAQSIVETDHLLSVMYLGYDNLTQFYTEMSAVVPDQDSQISKREYCTDSCITRRQIPIPHLVLQALDDPLSTWRNNAADDPTSILYPSNLIAENAQKNIVVLLTETGGHVGWPIGWWPHSWEFMNDFVAAGFVTAWDQYVHDSEPTSLTSRGAT